MNDRLPIAKLNLKPQTTESKDPVAGARFDGDELERIKIGIGKRIVEIFGENDASTARRLQTTGATVSKYTKGERFPAGDLLIQMRRAAAVNLHWLLTGEGPVFVMSDLKQKFTDEQTAEIMKLAERTGRDFMEMIVALCEAQLQSLKIIESK